MNDASSKLLTILKLVNDWLRFAEAKNAVLLAFSGSGMAAILAYLRNSDGISHTLQSGFLISLSLFCLAALYSACSFPPKTNLDRMIGLSKHLHEEKDFQKEDNLYYFGHLKKYTAESLFKEISERYFSPDIESANHRECIDICSQIVVNSSIAFSKFSLFSRAVLFLIFALIIPPAFLLIDLFLPVAL